MLTGDIVARPIGKREDCPSPRYCENPHVYASPFNETLPQIVYLKRGQRGIYLTGRYYCAACATDKHIKRHRHMNTYATCYQCGKRIV